MSTHCWHDTMQGLVALWSTLDKRHACTSLFTFSSSCMDSTTGLKISSMPYLTMILNYDGVPSNTKKLYTFKRRSELRMKVPKQVVHQTYDKNYSIIIISLLCASWPGIHGGLPSLCFFALLPIGLQTSTSSKYSWIWSAQGSARKSSEFWYSSPSQ